MRILFVEDHPALRYGIASEMRSHGHTVIEAESAESALAILAQSEVDVLVTDVGLPGASGDVFAAEARALQPALRLIFATGLDSIRQPGSGDHGTTVLRKPYTWDAMEAALVAVQ